MKTARGQSGFTIVETLVVLAVTGALFLIAFYAINGKQNETAFQQAINDTQSIIQQSIAQVGQGDYPNTDNFTCNAAGGVLNILPGANQQGSNTGCVFLGKALQFGVHNTSPEQYISYTIAGLQNNGGSLSAASPTAVAPGNSTNNAAGFPDASIKSELHNGLTVVSMNSVSGGGVKTPIGAVAFISSLGSYSGSQLISGSKQIDLVAVKKSAINTTSDATVDAINKFLASSTVNPGGGVQICFASGGTNQSGLMTIGSNGRDLSVSLTIKGNRTCT
jgi:prepilin-type N-terminal cleavage/methylation domain-containing protein